MKKAKGQNTLEFAIILALVVIVGVFVLTNLGKNVFNTFALSTEKYKAYDPYGFAKNDNNSNSIVGGYLGGNASQPVSQCDNGLCTIDYGRFIFSGVPDDFSEFIETSGSSGGGDKFADLLTQLANQLELEDKDRKTNDIRRLADLIRLQADRYKFLEDQIAGGLDDAGLHDTYFYKNFETTGYKIPAHLKDVLPDLKLNNSFSSTFAFSNDIGFARSTASYNPSYAATKVKSEVGAAIVDQFDTIMKNDKYPEDVKSMVKNIYSGAADLSFQTGSLFNAKSQPGQGGSSGYQEHDPITGQKLGIVSFKGGPPGDILKPKMSLELDLAKSLLSNN